MTDDEALTLRLTIGGQRCPRAGCCVASVVPGTPSAAICSGLPVPRGPAHPHLHGHQITRDDYGASAERATEAVCSSPAGFFSVPALAVRLARMTIAAVGDLLKQVNPECKFARCARRRGS